MKRRLRLLVLLTPLALTIVPAANGQGQSKKAYIDWYTQECFLGCTEWCPCTMIGY